MNASLLHASWYLASIIGSQSLSKQLLAQACNVSQRNKEFNRAVEFGIEIGWLRDVEKKIELTNAGAKAIEKHWRFLEPTKDQLNILHANDLAQVLLAEKKEKSRPKILDLFSGVGGLGLGFESAGLRLKASVDNDPEAVGAHAKNFPHCRSILGDINEMAVNPRSFLEAHGIDSSFDGVIGGPPCQGFSNIGERVIEDDRNFLTTQFAKIVLELKPKFFVLENVPGLKMIGTKKPFYSWLIENSGPISLYASQLSSKLPTPIFSAAKRQEQFKKRTISSLIRGTEKKLFEKDDLSFDLVEDCFSATTILVEQLELAPKGIIDENELKWVSASMQIIRGEKSLIDKLVIGLVLKTWKKLGESQKVLQAKLEAALDEGNFSVLSELFSIYTAAPDFDYFKGQKVGPVLKALLKRFEKEYEVAPPQTLIATDFGCPQIRQRLFLVGIRKDLDSEFIFPEATHTTKDDEMLLERCPNCEDAIGDLPDVDKYSELIAGDKIPTSELAKPNSKFQEVARMHFFNEENFSLPRLDYNPFEISSNRRTIHADHVLKRLRTTEEGIQDKKSGKTRLRRKGYSVTLRAGTREAKGSHTAVRPVHFSYHRVISVREGARLMGFPDWFELHPTKWHGFRLVGNAVPEVFGRNLGSKILQVLDLK